MKTTNEGKATASRRWWGDYSLALAETACWRLGELALWGTRSETEWSFLYRHEAGSAENRGEVDLTARIAPPVVGEEGVTGRRFAFRATTDSCNLLPALPDRPLVVRLESELTIPPGEAVTVFMGLPLWVQFATKSGGVHLLDLPLTRVSDTWFGQLTGAGELCYASRTTARQDLAKLPPTSTRARAAVRIENRVSSTLSLETLLLPVGNLSLFAEEGGRLWTEAVTLVHEEEGESAALELGEGPPRQASRAELLNGPRRVARKRITLHVFGNLLRGGIDALRSGKSRASGMVDT